VDHSKICYLDYGFPSYSSRTRHRSPDELFTFGYIGTHKQAKGIFHLIQAFEQLDNVNTQLKIWGPPLEPFTSSLKSYIAKMHPVLRGRIHWMGGYVNHRIVDDVFNHVDTIVVPSIWGENSPLVIHEALDARVAVITADYGGMGEYIHHEINGLVFKHRSIASLTQQMKRLVSDPDLLERIAQRGYLQSPDGRIPSIEAHAQLVETYYLNTIKQRRQYDEAKSRPMAYHI
jgi:glycosyltransferase involved in cell wall biosynthesis